MNGFYGSRKGLENTHARTHTHTHARTHVFRDFGCSNEGGTARDKTLAMQER